MLRREGVQRGFGPSAHHPHRASERRRTHRGRRFVGGRTGSGSPHGGRWRRGRRATFDRLSTLHDEKHSGSPDGATSSRRWGTTMGLRPAGGDGISPRSRARLSVTRECSSDLRAGARSFISSPRASERSRCDSSTRGARPSGLARKGEARRSHRYAGPLNGSDRRGAGVSREIAKRAGVRGSRPSHGVTGFRFVLQNSIDDVAAQTGFAP